MNKQYYKNLSKFKSEEVFRWSEDLTRTFFKFFSKKNGPADCLDVGANFGFHCDTFIDYCLGNNTLIAIEPDFRTYESLEVYLKKINCKYILLTAPVSNESKYVYFKLDKAYQLSKIDYSATPNIQTITIDQISNAYNLKYIKIDAEDEDMNVIIGAKNTISRCRPIIASEWSVFFDKEKQSECYDFFINQEYHCIDLFGQVMNKDLFVGNDYTFHNRFFIPKELESFLTEYTYTISRFFVLLGLNSDIFKPN